MEMINKINLNADMENKGYIVVHPLDDQPEEKCSVEGLGLMPYATQPPCKIFVIVAQTIPNFNGRTGLIPCFTGNGSNIM